MKPIVTSLFIVIFTLSEGNAQKTINDEIALKIGDVQISTYEIEKNLAKNAGKYGSPFAQSEKKVRLNKFIDQTLFLADAYQKGYVNDKRVNYDVNRVAKVILTQPFGLYEEKVLFKNIEVSEEEIRKEYENKTKDIVSFFFFNSLNEMKIAFNNNIPKSKEEFYKAIQEHQNLKSINFFADSLLCMCQFSNMAKKLDSLKENEVSKPILTTDGAFLILLKKKKVISSIFNEKIKNEISSTLQSQKKFTTRKKFLEELTKSFAIEIDSGMVKEMFSKVLKDNHFLERNMAIDKDLFTDVLSHNLFAYKNGNTRTYKTINEFIDYLNNAIIRQPIRDQNTIFSYIESMPVEEWYYNQALKLKLDQDTKYLLDKQNFKNKVIRYYYEKDWLETVRVTEQEVVEYYSQHLNSFNDTNVVKISALYFKTEEGAQNALKILNDGNIKDTIQIIEQIKKFGLEECIWKQKVLEVKNEVPLRIKYIVDKLKENEFSESIKDINGRNFVIRKIIEHGIQIKSLPEVEPNIRMTIASQKLEELKTLKLVELKQKYVIKNNIDSICSSSLR